MSQFYALASAVMFGLGDFTGGFITRRLAVWAVMMWSQLIGLGVLALGFLLVPVESVTRGDLAYGALGGAAGFVGLSILYTALARGSMSVVAPITGATGAVLPVVVDVAGGHGLTGLEWLGIGLGIGAVLLLTYDVKKKSLSRESLLLAMTAGAAFAVFFIALAQTDEASGLWPVAAARAVSIPIAITVALVLGVAHRPKLRDTRLLTTAGSLDMAANVSVLLALQRGSLAVSTVLSSLYPAFTAIAAVVILRERPTNTQTSGIAMALGSVIALAV